MQLRRDSLKVLYFLQSLNQVHWDDSRSYRGRDQQPLCSWPSRWTLSETQSEESAEEKVIHENSFQLRQENTVTVLKRYRSKEKAPWRTWSSQLAPWSLCSCFCYSGNLWEQIQSQRPSDSNYIGRIIRRIHLLETFWKCGYCTQSVITKKIF